jgi:hypothetical protein
MQRNIQNAAFRQLLENHLSMLTPYRKKTDTFTAKIKTNGYSEIAYSIASLLKLSVIALEPENSSEASAYDIMSALEMALSLLPYEEFELLDILFAELLEAPVFEEMPLEATLYNYSTEMLASADTRLRNYQL